MQDDVRPVRSNLPPSRPKPNLAGKPDDQRIDEQKLEAEFGPPVNPDGDPPMPTKLQRVKKLIPKVRVPHHKRELALLIIAIILMVAAAAVSFIILQKQPTVLSGIFTINQKPYVPKTVPSTLTGLQVKPSINNRPVTAVMIENSLEARPQSGLDQAGVVFEALAEGGITRFMALYQDSQPDYLGPVRSARPYYIQWLLGFDAAYAHVGGSPDGLNDITAWHVKDLNQFYNGDFYQRITSRYAPHNVYTSMAQLNHLEAIKHFGKPNYAGFVRKKKETPLDKPTVTRINIYMSGYYYDSSYTYDRATNTYKRSQGGEAHTQLHKDGSKVQIAPKVVVAMIIPEHSDAQGHYAIYSTLGSGTVLVFQDGGVIKGTWTKAQRTDQIVFKDSAGQPLALDPGQTWIAAVPNSTSNVTYRK